MAVTKFGQPNEMRERFRRANETVDIIRLCESLGLRLHLEAGINFIPCPYHTDNRRPNMALYPEPGDRMPIPRGYCFSCKRVASPIDLLTQFKGLSPYESLCYIENLTGSTPPPPTPAPKKPELEKPAVNIRPQIDLTQERLWGKDGQHARDYLERRGLLEAAQEYQFGLWWDDHTYWSGRLVIPYLTSLSPGAPVYAMAGRLLGNDRSGGIRASEVGNSGAGHGRILQGQGVAVGKDHRPTGRPKYLFSTSQSREPYNWRIVREQVQRDLLLVTCEGELDGASVLYATGGAYGVVALGGSGAVQALLPEVPGITVIYIRDRGEPGAEAGHESGVAALRRSNATVYELMPPDINPGKKTDMNDMLVAYGVEGLSTWLADEIAAALYDSERELV